MTDLDMLKHLLKKTGRTYDEIKHNNKTIIQIHVANIRYEWNFDECGNVVEDWDNISITTWISEGAYIYD